MRIVHRLATPLLACAARNPDPLELHPTMTTVLAYLDPGSGSMILQILAGGLAAVAVTAKL